MSENLKHVFYADVEIHDGLKAEKIVGAPEDITLSKACDIMDQLKSTYIATNGFEFTNTTTLSNMWNGYVMYDIPNYEDPTLIINSKEAIDSDAFEFKFNITVKFSPGAQKVTFTYYTEQGYNSVTAGSLQVLETPFDFDHYGTSQEIDPNLTNIFKKKIINTNTVPIALDEKNSHISFPTKNTSIAYMSNYKQGFFTYDCETIRISDETNEDYKWWTVYIRPKTFVLFQDYPVNFEFTTELKATIFEGDMGLKIYFTNIYPIQFQQNVEKATLTIDENSLTDQTKSGLIKVMV